MHDRGCRAQQPLATVHDFSSFFIYLLRKEVRTKQVCLSVQSTRSRDRLSGRGEFAVKSVKRDVFHLYLREL